MRRTNAGLSRPVAAFARRLSRIRFRAALVSFSEIGIGDLLLLCLGIGISHEAEFGEAAVWDDVGTFLTLASTYSIKNRLVRNR